MSTPKKVLNDVGPSSKQKRQLTSNGPTSFHESRKRLSNTTAHEPVTTDLPSRPRRSKVFSPQQKVQPRVNEVESGAQDQDRHGVAEISSTGDLILEMKHTLGHTSGPRQGSSVGEHRSAFQARQSTDRLPNGGTITPGNESISTCLYRVGCDTLRDSSPYFRMLLDPTKFEEGRVVAEKHKDLVDKVGQVQLASAEDLPHLTIMDVGRISAVKSIHILMTDFLRMLQGQDISNPQPPLANVANLCIVADRFDALDVVRRYFTSRKILQLLDGKGPAGAASRSLPEEKTRQRLLVGLLLDDASWVWQASLRLVQQGWVGCEVPDDAALWWDLPNGIEEELLYRRECVLDTIQSLQSYFLRLYTSSRERQCRLGYDSSTECDIFQLGQMIRFFDKIGTLSLAGTILPLSYSDEAPEQQQQPYHGDIIHLLDSMRQCPEYQIDKNHSHCGLRTRLMPLLDLVEHSLTEIGICASCWRDARPEYAWSLSKRPLIWRFGPDVMGRGGAGARRSLAHPVRHQEVRDMFTAQERLWVRQT